jgi:hypothetical protein
VRLVDGYSSGNLIIFKIKFQANYRSGQIFQTPHKELLNSLISLFTFLTHFLIRFTNGYNRLETTKYRLAHFSLQTFDSLPNKIGNMNSFKTKTQKK